MKHLPAGQLKTKAWFQNLTSSNDGYNTETWTDDFFKWVRIETGVSKELEQSGQLMGEATHTIKCRYTDRITANHRVRIKTVHYEIIGKPINVNLENINTMIVVRELTNA